MKTSTCHPDRKHVAHGLCRECYNFQYHAKWYKENFEKAKIRIYAYRTEHMVRLNALKNVPCVDCGGRFPPECMDFDHVRGKKLFLVSTARQRSIETSLAEIAKCEVVCANCHRIRTKRRVTNG